MNELVQMCLEDMNKLKRQKVETLVTIHVRQMEIFVDIKAQLFVTVVRGKVCRRQFPKCMEASFVDVDDLVRFQDKD